MDPSFNHRSSILLTLVILWMVASAAAGIRLVFFPEIGWRLILAGYAFSLVVLPLVFFTLRWIHIRMEGIMPYEQWGIRRFIVQNGVFIVMACLTARLLFMFVSYLDTQYHLIDPNTKAFIFSKYLQIIVYTVYIMLFSMVNLGFYTSYLFASWRAALTEKTRLEVAAAELEREKSRVQYENLKNQLNPHFLFNSFTSLNSLITKDPSLAQRFLQQLAKVYRHLLQHDGNSLVTLQTETDFVANYIALQTTRFQKGLAVELHVPARYADRKIVPVTLQILVENAIKHNIIDEEQTLRICVNVTADNYLVIDNNIQLKKNVEHSNRQGLNSLKRLYAYYSPLPVTVSAGNGIFSVKIPLL